jgi:hypothetical protein
MEGSDEEGKGRSLVHYSELLFDKDTNKEIESFMMQESIREKDVSQDDALQIQHANEQTCNNAGDNHAIITKEEVDSSSEIKNCMQIETKRCEKRNDITETSPRKQVHSNDGNEKIDCDVGIVENVGVNSLEGMEHSDDLSESKTGKKNNPNVVHTKGKDPAEVKSLNLSSTKTTSVSPLWDNYILAVRGIPPNEAGVS